MLQTKSIKNNKILYIEDDFNNSVLMKRVLEADGYQVSLASDGSTGLAQAQHETPDLILLDIYMPDMTGHQVARRLRRMEPTKDTPILMVTVSQANENKQLSVAAGCNGYISKPIDVDHITEEIELYL